MTTIEATRIARNLMDEHDLLSWNFRLDNAKRRLGCCKAGIKTITVSRPYISVLTVEQYKNVVLHEIAHAIVGTRHHHDYVWERKAKEIGCDGSRVFKGIVERPEGKYIAECPKCKTVYYAYKTKKRRSSCGKCNSVFDSECELHYKPNPTYRR